MNIEDKEKLSDLIHDIKTPLTAALGYCDLDIMKNDTKSSKIIKEQLQKINDYINQINEIVKKN